MRECPSRPAAGGAGTCLRWGRPSSEASGPGRGSIRRGDSDLTRRGGPDQKCGPGCRIPLILISRGSARPLSARCGDGASPWSRVGPSPARVAVAPARAVAVMRRGADGEESDGAVRCGASSLRRICWRRAERGGELRRLPCLRNPPPPAACSRTCSPDARPVPTRRALEARVRRAPSLRRRAALTPSRIRSCRFCSSCPAPC
jgi:hypothetical protein